MSIELMMPSKHLISSCQVLLLPSVFPRVFPNESAHHIRWPKYWSFSISPSSEYLVLISLRIDWLDLVAVQGTLKSFLQYTSVKNISNRYMYRLLCTEEVSWLVFLLSISVSYNIFCILPGTRLSVLAFKAFKNLDPNCLSCFDPLILLPIANLLICFTYKCL